MEKLNKIKEYLTCILKSNDKLNEYEFQKYLKEITLLSKNNNVDYLLDLLFAVGPSHTMMEKYFDNKLSLSINTNVLHDYFSTLYHYSCFSKSMDVLYKYKKYLNTDDLLMQAFNIALIYLDINMIDFIYKKAKKINNNLELIELLNIYKQQIIKIRKLINCSDEDIKNLVDIISSILKECKKNIVGVDLSNINEFNKHYIIYMNTDDLDIIVDANFKLADKIASFNDELILCNLIIQFSPIVSK